jgi:phosphatidylserine/phosphatidylglycerophosphate/cardiolipin synthase-like enzyme
MQIREETLDRLQSAYSDQIPDLFIDEISDARKQISSLKSIGDTDIAITCGILGRDDIRSKLESLISSSSRKLYFLVAFYEANVDFLSAFLAKHVAEKSLDFRIMYRPRDAQNRRLILDLASRLKPHGYTDFYRAYDSKYVTDEYVRNKANVGNLHAKIAMNESELLVGSANLTHLSLNQNLETAIYTRNPRVIENAMNIYEVLWEAFDAPGTIE